MSDFPALLSRPRMLTLVSFHGEIHGTKLWTCPLAVYLLRKREKLLCSILSFLFLIPIVICQFFEGRGKSAWKAINSANFEGFAKQKDRWPGRWSWRDKLRRRTSKASSLYHVTSTTRPHKLPFYAISLPIYTGLARLLFFLALFSPAPRKPYQGQYSRKTASFFTTQKGEIHDSRKFPSSKSNQDKMSVGKFKVLF